MVDAHPGPPAATGLQQAAPRADPGGPSRSGQGPDRQQAAGDRPGPGHPDHRRGSGAPRRAAVGAGARGGLRAGLPHRPARARTGTTARGMSMHRLLRRQLEAHFGSKAEAPPRMEKLLREIDAQYQRADQDREALQRALALLADLAQRQSVRVETGKVPGARPAFSKSMHRLFEQAPFGVAICDTSLQITSWNARDELREMTARGDPQRWLRPVVTRTGDEWTCEWTLVPLRDRRGTVAGLAALMQEPLAGRDRFALALEASGDGAWDWDLRTKRLWVSDSWRAIA